FPEVNAVSTTNYGHRRGRGRGRGRGKGHSRNFSWYRGGHNNFSNFKKMTTHQK
ncbi:hypothetical protein TorRG33x02_031180, partial [Trema orientale]